MSEEQEKKHQKIGMAVTIGVHALILGLFFFMLAWREPDPPIPEYGIELNFGLDNQGSGESPQPQPAPVVEEVEAEVVEEPVPEVTSEPTLEETAEQVTPDDVVTQEEPSPDVVEDVPESEPEPVDEPAEEVSKPAIPEVQPYPGSTSNQGDDANESGDKGKEKGTIDARAIYGAQGSSQGASLQMEGWNWDFIPRPNDTSTESGKIVFQVTIDDQGEVIGVRTIEKTVSPAVERLYQEAVERITFSRTAENIRPSSTSTGRITFIIRSR